MNPLVQGEPTVDSFWGWASSDWWFEEPLGNVSTGIGEGISSVGQGVGYGAQGVGEGVGDSARRASVVSPIVAGLVLLGLGGLALLYARM